MFIIKIFLILFYIEKRQLFLSISSLHFRITNWKLVRKSRARMKGRRKKQPSRSSDNARIFWVHMPAMHVGLAPLLSPLSQVSSQPGGKSVKKSLGKKTGWRPHNGGRDYVGALGIPYSGSASLKRISERISVWSVCDRVCSHPSRLRRSQEKCVRKKEKEKRTLRPNERKRCHGFWVIITYPRVFFLPVCIICTICKYW